MPVGDAFPCSRMPGQSLLRSFCRCIRGSTAAAPCICYHYMQACLRLIWHTAAAAACCHFFVRNAQQLVVVPGNRQLMILTRGFRTTNETNALQKHHTQNPPPPDSTPKPPSSQDAAHPSRRLAQHLTGLRTWCKQCLPATSA